MPIEVEYLTQIYVVLHTHKGVTDFSRKTSIRICRTMNRVKCQIRFKRERNKRTKRKKERKKEDYVLHQIEVCAVPVSPRTREQCRYSQWCHTQSTSVGHVVTNVTRMYSPSWLFLVCLDLGHPHPYTAHCFPQAVEIYWAGPSEDHLLFRNSMFHCRDHIRSILTYSQPA